MKENKSIAETNNTAEVEGTTKAETATEVKNVTQAKKTGWKKYLDKRYWKIYAIVLLALIIAVTAIVWIALAGKNNDDSPEEYAQITMADLSKYALICASKTANSTMTQYWKLQSQIEDMLGAKPKAETDHIDATEFEILVGNTNREESKTFLSGLLWDDYGYAIVGNKIVIAGHTDEGTTNAMKHFLEHIKNGDHTTVFFSNKNQYLFRYPYISDTFMLNGIDVSRAKIVVNEEKGSDMQIAQSLSDKSLELCGRRPAIVSDFEVKAGDECLIIIGTSSYVPDAMRAEWDASYETTEGKSAYFVGKEENVVWIKTSVMEGYGAINRELLPQLQSESSVSATLTTGLFKLPQIFSVMSFNVFVSQFNTTRKDRVIATIRENVPSIFGVQEANDGWMSALRSDLGNEYNSVGVGREANLKGEYSAIFYRKDLFTLVDSGTKWLSNTPDEAGSKYQIPNTTYVANCPRVMTYAVLERQTDGVRFLYVNTHLDHDGNNNTTVASQIRRNQIEILLAQIDIVKNEFGNLPTIVTGDFNVSPGQSPYKAMTEGGYLDSSLIAWAGEPQSTYNNMEDDYKGAIIDYIFVSPDLAGAVDSYMVCPAKRDGEWVSDHNAIIASITLPTTEPQE